MSSGQIEHSWFDGDLWSLTLEKGYPHDRWTTSTIDSFTARERSLQNVDRAKSPLPTNPKK